MAKPIEIFRVGRHTASDGRALSFSESDVDKMIAAYDPAAHEAPLVVGHPESNKPSYGYVQKLSRDGEVVRVDGVRKLDLDFAELVNSGKFDKVSVSLYPPDAPSNPKRGGYYLRHVGFFGAVPPAIKGLQPAEFKDGDQDFVTIEFGEADRSVGHALRSLRDWLVGKFGLEEAEKALPPWTVSHVQEQAARDDGNPSFAESDEDSTPPGGNNGSDAGAPGAQGSDATPDAQSAAATAAAAPGEPTNPQAPNAAQADDRETELKKREDALKAREAELEKKEKKVETDAHRNFCEKLVAEGRPLPCSVDTVVNFMRILAGEPANFGEGEERTALAIFKEDFLANLEKQVDFSERAAPETGDDVDTEDPMVLAQAIKNFQEERAAAGIVITTSEAAAAVLKQRR